MHTDWQLDKLGDVERSLQQDSQHSGVLWRPRVPAARHVSAQ